MELTALHLEHGAEDYRVSTPAIVRGTTRHTALRDGLRIVTARFGLTAPLSSSVLLPPGLALSLVLDGHATMPDGQRHGPGTYIFDIAATSRWRRMQADAGQNFRFVSLSAPMQSLGRLGLEGLAGAFDGVRVRSMPGRVSDLSHFLMNGDSADPASSLLREAASLEIVARLLTPAVAPQAAGPLAPREVRALEEVRLIIASELHADLTIDGLARRTGLSVSRLKALYRSRTGAGLGASVMEARLVRAQELLRDDGRQVAEIAYAVGYTPAHLATAFRKRFGSTPTAFRRETHARSKSKIF